MNSNHCSLLCLAAILWLIGAPGCQHADAAQPDELRYLTFQLFTYDPATPRPLSRAKLEASVSEIIEAVETRGDGKRRKLGFAVGPLSLDQTDEELREIIDVSFEIAAKYDIAVVIHIDDSMFWKRRSSLWQDPRNVEWIDWKGTTMPHRYVPWVGTGLGPQMCYNSPVLRTEVGRIAQEIIGGAIAKNVSELRGQGKSSLFAGVIVGWESHLYDYRYASKDRVVEALMKRDGVAAGTPGYHALANAGFSADNLPEDFHGELQKVLADWVRFWAKSIHKSGIARDRIYTHVMFPPAQGHLPINQIRSQFEHKFNYLGLIAHAAPSTAFNEFSRPGFSTYPSGIRTENGDALFATIERELKAKSVKSGWASAEGTNVNSAMTGMSWTQYLDWMETHGATVINIFGWEENQRGQFGQATRSKEALSAFTRFLTGPHRE